MSQDLQIFTNLYKNLLFFTRTTKIFTIFAIVIQKNISFWTFYFSGPHPDNYLKDMEKLVMKINSINRSNFKVDSIIKTTAAPLLSEWPSFNPIIIN